MTKPYSSKKFINPNLFRIFYFKIAPSISVFITELFMIFVYIAEIKEVFKICKSLIISFVFRPNSKACVSI